MPNLKSGSANWTGYSVVAAVSCLMAGCLRDLEPIPFNNETLGLLVKSRKEFAHLSEPRVHRLDDITDESATRLVEALGPIRTVKVGDLPPDAVDYSFGFAPGRNPVQFRVHLAGDHLVYAEGQFLYEGGDPRAFKREADAILAKR